MARVRLVGLDAAGDQLVEGLSMFGAGGELLVLLDAPPEVLFARKGEGTLASLARRREDYLGLAAAGIDRSFAVVSATQPVDTVVADVATIVREAATGR